MKAVFLFTLFTVLLACINSQESNGGHPMSVDSRFFGLGGGIGELFNSFLPGINLGNQGGLGRNPQGMDFPANSQFYPDSPIQGQNPHVLPEQGIKWPVLDDASQFLNQGNPGTQPQYPPQGNVGGYPQYPPQGNNGRYPQYPSGNFGGTSQNPMYPQYPNQDNFGGTSQNPMYPQYPNQGNFGGTSQNTMYPQYPNQGNFGGGSNPQYPNSGGLPNQYPNSNQGGFMYPRNPNQGNLGSTQPPVPLYPGNNGRNPSGNDFPNQGGNWNQDPSNSGPGTGQGDGTLDGVVPPSNPQDPWNTDAPNDFSLGGINTPSGTNSDNPPVHNPNEGNAILGRPVQIPPTTTEAGRINYPSSTENPAKRQCVQDCQTTTEYNPVCGSDDITYINPGKFVCARNCGMNVFVAQRGRCGNIPNPRNVISSNFRPSWT